MNINMPKISLIEKGNINDYKNNNDNKDDNKEEKREEKKEDLIEEKNDKIEEKKEIKETINLANIENKKMTPENNMENSPNIMEKEKNNSNNNVTPINNIKKKITFKEAQQSIKDFMGLLNETEEKIKMKYGNCLPDFSCEEQLPIAWRTKLINKFFESDEMKNIVNKMKEAQSQKQN